MLPNDSLLYYQYGFLKLFPNSTHHKQVERRNCGNRVLLNSIHHPNKNVVSDITQVEPACVTVVNIYEGASQ
jgi:hypothetical protein